jgi:hypothetical protein
LDRIDGELDVGEVLGVAGGDGFEVLDGAGDGEPGLAEAEAEAAAAGEEVEDSK